MSIGLGIGIGATYALSACASHFYALRRAQGGPSDRSFMNIVFGGMLLRMVLMLAAVALCAGLLPLKLLPFTVSLVGMLLLSMVVEVGFIWLRHRKATSDNIRASAAPLALLLVMAAALPAQAQHDEPSHAAEAQAEHAAPAADELTHGAHGAAEGEVDINAVGHSADGYYLDFAPFGSIELPRLLLVREADGGIGFDAFASTHAALESGLYSLGMGQANLMSLQQVEMAIASHEHLYFPLVRTEGAIIVDFSITRHLVFLLIAALILLLIALDTARRYKKGLGREEAPRGRWQNMMEVFVVFIRDEIAKPTIGRGYQKYLPYLITVFFLILICNWLGLVPWGASATSNVMVTGTLAVCTLLVVIFSGTREYWGHMFNPPGVPTAVKFILAPMEVIGMFTKHVALAFRLFGNMVSGHLVLVSILGLIFIFTAKFGSPVGWGVAFFVSLPLTIFIFVLKLAVGIIQAYVFTILSALFIGLALEEHEHAHEHEPEDENQYRPHAMEQAEEYVPDRAKSLEEALEDGGRRRELAGVSA